MKYAKKQQHSSVITVLLVIIFVLSAFIGGCWVGTKVLPKEQDQLMESALNETDGISQETTDKFDETTEDTNESLSFQETTTAAEAPSLVEQYIVYELSGEDLVVPTPYCTLYYPAQFEEFLRIGHEFSDELYAVHFDAYFGEGETENLFSVYFAKDDGRQPDGVIVGGVPDENGEVVMIIVTTNPELPKSEWSQDTSNLVYAMQEGISYCTEKIGQLDNLILDQ